MLNQLCDIVHIVNTLRHWDQGLCEHSPKAQRMSTTRQSIQLGPDPSEMLQSSLEQFRTTRTLLYPMGHGSMVIPLPVGDWGLTTTHIIPFLNTRVSLTTKLLHNHHNFNPQPVVSYAGPAPTGLACQLMPMPKCSRTV